MLTYPIGIMLVCLWAEILWLVAELQTDKRCGNDGWHPRPTPSSAARLFASAEATG